VGGGKSNANHFQHLESGWAVTTLKLPNALARRNCRENTLNRWCTYKAPPDGKPAPRPQDAAARIHGGLAQVKAAALRPISERCFFTIGSCFARRIERFLLARKARVPSADSVPFQNATHLFRLVQPASGLITFLNRYNLPSMLQELHILRDGFPQDDPNWLLYENGEKWCDLHYAWNFHDISLEECHERRGLVFRHLSRALRDANTYLLTLGLCEAWFDRRAQAYLNSTPPPRVTSANPDRFEFHFLDYDDNLQALSSIHELLCQLKGGQEFEVIVTVSPVPLSPTFTTSDVVVANTEAKAILRAVAGEAARRFSRVTYFPSYEIVMHSDPTAAWQQDRLHVQPSMTEHVVASFFELLDPDDKTDGTWAPKSKPSSTA
jgi:GSCFA family protein